MRRGRGRRDFQTAAVCFKADLAVVTSWSNVIYNIDTHYIHEFAEHIDIQISSNVFVFPGRSQQFSDEKAKTMSSF